MTLRRYERYKDSGVEWLGAVPAHWDVAAVSYRYEVLLGKMLDEKRITGNHLAPYLRNIDVQWDRINVDELPQMDFSGDDLARYCLIPGDLLVCEGGEVGRAAIWRGQLDECYYQKAIHRLRQRVPDSDHPRFMFYVLRMATALGVFEASEGKSTIAHLTAEGLRRYRLAFPSRAEQEGIATYLDGETAKIDTLIAEQQRLIKLLTEKRQGVIAHAVTKGLNPAAPMKDSGVEWLGSVPSHWPVGPLRRAFSSVDYGISESLDVEGRVAVLRMGNIGGGEVILDDLKYVDSVDADLLLRSGDLLFNRTNSVDQIGKVGLFRTDSPEPISFASYLVRLRTAATSIPEYFAYLLNCSGVLGEARANAIVAIGQCNLNPTRYGAFVVAVPPRVEQLSIAAFLDLECAELDLLMQEAGAATELLRERRTALISAAVTRQIDVRWAEAVESNPRSHLLQHA